MSLDEPLTINNRLITELFYCLLEVLTTMPLFGYLLRSIGCLVTENANNQPTRQLISHKQD